MKYTTKIAVSAATLASLLVPAFAFAEIVNTSATTNVTAQAAGTSVRASVTASSAAETTRAARAKDKAAQEIDRRIKALNSLMVRVQAMAKVSETLKANLKINVQNEIDAFAALKAKIEADTDLATLKTDIKTITESYRIFVLVLPQGHITAAADRMATVINMMAQTGTKLQARINTAAQAGGDTTALATALNDLGVKLTSAQTHAQASVNLVAPLVPDNGDKTVMATNEAALKKAHEELKAGRADLVEGRKDIEIILKGLKNIKASATSTSTVTP